MGRNAAEIPLSVIGMDLWRNATELVGDDCGYVECGQMRIAETAAEFAKVEARVAGQGRLLIRYSGTEPLLRVMLEGQRQDEIRGWAQEIVDVVKEHLG